MTPALTLSPRPARFGRYVAAAVLASAGLAVSGCTADGGGTVPLPTSTAAGASTTTPAAAQVADATKEMHDVRCKHDDDGWTLSGKVTNAGKATKNYTVIARVASKKNTKTTLGLTTITKTVASGKTVSFVAKNFSTLGSDGRTCVTTASKS